MLKHFLDASWAEFKKTPLNSMGTVIGAAGLVVALKDIFVGAPKGVVEGLPKNAAPEDLIRWLVLIACANFVLASVGGYIYRRRTLVGTMATIALGFLAAFVCAYLTYRILGPFAVHVSEPGPAPGSTKTEIAMAGLDLGKISGISVCLWGFSVLSVNVNRLGELIPKVWNSVDASDRSTDPGLASMYAITGAFMIPAIVTLMTYGYTFGDIVKGLLEPIIAARP